MPHADPEKRRAYLRDWRERHAEQERARGREKYRRTAAAVCARTNARAKLPEVIERKKELRVEKMADRKSLIARIKSDRGCAACGENHPACLDFHHPDPLSKERHGKASTISDIMRKASLERLMREVEACEVLCANCHRKAHAEMGYEWLEEVT